MANTTRFNYLIPDVGLDEDTWGDKLNAYFELLEGRVFDKELGDTTPSAVITDSLTIPVLNAAQRDALTPVDGLVIFNTDINQYEGYFSALGKWTQIAGEALSTLSVTESLTIPVLTQVQRDALTPVDGLVIYNTDINQYEGYFAILGAWGSLGGGATGGGADQVFVLNDQVVTQDYSIPVGKNAHSAGPITIADGVTVTIPDGSSWVISG